MKYTKGKRKTLKLGSLAALSLGVAACGPSIDQPLPLPKDPVQFANATECIAAGFDTTGCHDAYQAALTQHQAEAPKYANQMLCENDWGTSNCQQVAQGNGGSFFMPFMAGYLLADALDDAFDYKRKGYYRAGTALGSPIYRGRGGYVQYQKREDEDSTVIINNSGYASNRRYASSTVPVTASKPAPRVNVTSSTTSRGGFGSSMGGKSFGG